MKRQATKKNPIHDPYSDGFKFTIPEMIIYVCIAGTAAWVSVAFWIAS